MRSSSHCESYCAPPLCYLPCLPKSKDDAGGDPKSASPSPAAVAEDKPPVVQKIEESAPAAAAAATGSDGGGDDDKCYREVAVAPKCCLKRANCEDSSKIVAKGNVKWRDSLGKDLTQVKEFEPSESGDSDDEEYTGACACVGTIATTTLWAGLDWT
ncbi:unnamed protein product [Miscanthus lutarioriparius]|uniref:Uncharacterized protein n=1 Tax=Miscanthus lutarioriparius TaxID=422564 RepID=A0A811NBV4_9POAL|nr:unnamed protein product [Miscanthus lutarioriparius]CAD6341597.1 unnamed protein product [Miscanthus lutarioriparius]